MHLGHEELNGRGGHEAGRALLARLYGQATGRALPDIAVTSQGKPYFPCGDWHFSVSHTKNHVFCGLSRKNIGIDAEEMTRSVPPNVARKVLSASEYARYEAASDPAEALLRLWVLKEAYAKLTGRGLGDYLFQTDFDPQDSRIQTVSGCYVAVLTEEDTHAV